MSPSFCRAGSSRRRRQRRAVVLISTLETRRQHSGPAVLADSGAAEALVPAAPRLVRREGAAALVRVPTRTAPALLLEADPDGLRAMDGPDTGAGLPIQTGPDLDQDRLLIEDAEETDETMRATTIDDERLVGIAIAATAGVAALGAEVVTVASETIDEVWLRLWYLCNTGATYQHVAGSAVIKGQGPEAHKAKAPTQRR